MKFLTIICRRYSCCASALHCRVLLNQLSQPREVSFNGRFRYCKLVNDQSQLIPTVDSLSPKLCEWLRCTMAKAEEICAQLSKEECLHFESVEECIDFLKKNGVTSSMLVDNSWLLIFPLDDLKERLQILSKIGVVEDTVPLLRIPSRHLANVVDRWLLEADTVFKDNCLFVNRLQFLADNLHCSRHRIAMLMDRHHPLLTMDFERMSRIMRLLLECGIFREDIIKDMWIFRHNEVVFHERIEMAKNAGVEPMKTWMLRCPEDVFTNSLIKRKKRKAALGDHKDKVSYLAERLACSKDDIAALIIKYNRISKLDVPKLKLILDFVFDNGFTAEHVQRTPRVLGHSIHTLEQRLQELHRLGCHPKQLRWLVSTVEKYNELIESIRSAKRL